MFKTVLPLGFSPYWPYEVAAAPSSESLCKVAAETQSSQKKKRRGKKKAETDLEGDLVREHIFL